MKRLLGCLSILMVFPAFGSDVVVSWDKNPEPDIAEYRIYFGLSSRAYSSMFQSTQASYTLTNPMAGTFFAAVTAINVAGLESDFSQEIAFSVVAPQWDVTVLAANAVDGAWVPLTVVRVPWSGGLLKLRADQVAASPAPSVPSLPSPIRRAQKFPNRTGVPGYKSALPAW